MSLVLNSREVAVGTMVGLQKTQRKDDVIRGLSCFYAQSEENQKPKSQLCDENRNMVGGSDKLVRVSDSGKMNGFCLEDGCESSGSSSIGVAESSCTSTDEVDDGSSDAEVQSKLKSPLSSMDSLEESLPIKRGLSNFFAGKSKSFTSLSEASTVKDLAKPENAFNKRKRSLMICKRGFYTPQSSSYCNLLSPDFALEETEEEGETSENCPNVLPIQARRKLKCFTSPRSFSLTDLQRQGS